jgi:hypothetical protein
LGAGVDDRDRPDEQAVVGELDEAVGAVADLGHHVLGPFAVRLAADGGAHIREGGHCHALFLVVGHAVSLRMWQNFHFRPLPHGQGALRPGFATVMWDGFE